MDLTKDSISADRGSTITNASIDKSNNKIKKRSFWKGFLVGVLASLVANIIWFFIQNTSAG